MRAPSEGPIPKTTLYERHPGLAEAVKRGYPNTVLLIPDGDVRWASTHGLPPSAGHKRGAEILEGILPMFIELPTHTLIVWGFSHDNWGRDSGEIDGIMAVTNFTLQKNRDFFDEHQIRFVRLGSEEKIPEKYPLLWNSLCDIEEHTKAYTNKIFALALDFSGSDQTRRMIDRARLYGIPRDVEPTTLAFVEQLRDGVGLVKPADLIIRTSGEQRTSDPGWLNTNSEFFTIEKLLPDCVEPDFVAAYIEYPNRQRRFGARPNDGNPV